MKKNIPTLTLFMLVFIFGNINAQQCGFDSQRKKLLQDPNYVQLELTAEDKIQNTILFNRNSQGTVHTIPVVVHVLHLGEAVGSGTNISDSQIQSSIDNLNYFYRGQNPNSPIDFEVEFVLAQRDSECNATTGINRIDASGVANYSADGVSVDGPGADLLTLKDLSRWPEDEYFNIWIVTEFDGNNGGFGFQGFANFYNGYSYEGAVMMYSVFGYDPTNANPSWPLFNRTNSVVIHEVGHYFHLYHTFQGDDSNGDGISDTCPGDVTVGYDSDGCADTVPHQGSNGGCPANDACTDNPWVDNNTINNIMSYYSCADRLTNDQWLRVRAVLDNAAIVNSKGDEPPLAGFVAPTVAVCIPNTAFQLDDFTGIINVEMNGVSHSSSTAEVDGGNIDNTPFCTGIYEIDADVPNTLNVTLPNFNSHQLGVWIDWNNDGHFSGLGEKQYYADGIPADTTVPIVLTYPPSIPYGSFVRVRLIAELRYTFGQIWSIDSPCASLVTGQSEEYTIYVQPQEVLSVDDNELNTLNIYTKSNPKELLIIGELTTVTIANLYDIHGRLILSKELDQQSASNIINVSSFNTGIYIVKVFNNNQVTTQKLIIK